MANSPSKLLKKGIAWSSIGQIGTQVISFGFGIILARLLLPSEFGLLAMVLVFTGLADIFKDLGFGAAIIQKKEVSEDDLSTSFWLNVIVGVFLFSIFYFTSELIASFYDNPLMANITKVVAANFIISAISATHQSIVIRTLDFKLRAQFNLVSVLGSSIIGVYLAINDYGVWSLIISLMGRNILLTVLYWLNVTWKPKFIFNKKSFSNLFKFGSVATLNSFLGYLSKNADNLLIGKLLGDYSLGLYSRAYGLMLLPIRNISDGFKTAMFPTLSKIQDNKVEVKRLYLKSIKLVAFVSFPMMFGMSALCEPLVLFLYGENWMDMVPVLKLLSLLGALSSLMTFNGTIFYSLGRPEIETKIYLITTPILLLGFFIGIEFGGLIGLAWALIIVELAFSFYKVSFMKSLLGLTIPGFIENIKIIIFNTIVMFAILELINYYEVLNGIALIFELLILFIIGFFTYFLLSISNSKEVVRTFKSMIIK